MEINAKNIYISLLYMVNFIKSRKVDTGVINRVQKLKGFGDTTLNFISSILWQPLVTKTNRNTSNKSQR